MSRVFKLSESARKDLRKLTPLTRTRIQKKLIFYQNQTDPLLFGVALTGKNVVGYCRFRIGEYRVLCDADKKTIIIRSIRHRRESYRRR